MSKHRNRRQIPRKSIGLLLVVLTWCLAIGWLISLAANVQGTTSSSDIGTVDIVPPQYQLGQQLYLENCSSCHIALPPAVLPTETWKNLLQDTQHYGTQLKPLVDPPRILIWRYLSTFSRSLLKDEQVPYRVNSSRYFKALHPQVKLPRPVQISSCVQCHPQAANFNFRRLSTEWEKSQVENQPQQPK
jgi:hypothetical protein